MKKLNIFIKICKIILLITLFCSCIFPKKENYSQNQIPNTFIKCLDVSYVTEIEKNNCKYYIDNMETDFFEILKECGINTVRIRLWNNNDNGESSLENLILLAKRAKEKNMKFILDFHYSDTWADPSNQSKPKLWENLTFDELKIELKKYNYDIIKKCIEAGVYPDYVQAGNEISAGFLWDSGKIGGIYDENWDNFTELLKNAIQGIKEADVNDSIKIILHHHTGSDYNNIDWFFENISKKMVEYDIIGLSYYPFFSNDNINKLKDSIVKTKEKYSKPIIILETAYPWTYDWSDDTHNVFGKSNYILPEYPINKEGQKKYILDFLNEMYLIDCIGVSYWGGEWIAVEGHGSMWENIALFDFDGNILPALYQKW